MSIRVLIVDDHAGVRKLLRTLIKRASDIEVVGEAQNGPEALSQVNRLNPDVMLLDIEMPGMTGIDVARELKARNANVVILAISAYNDRQYILHMLNTGASGYLVKDEVPENIIPAIRDVARGRQGWVTNTHRPLVEARKSGHP